MGARYPLRMGVSILATDWSLDPDDDDETSQSGNKPDPVRAQLKKLEKQNQELQTKLAAAEAASRKSTIKDVLTEKKLNTKLAGLIPSSVDATPEAIEKWLEDYKDLFTMPEPKTEEPDPDAGTVDPQEMDLATVAAFNRMSKASAGATPPGKPGDLIQKLMSPDLTQEELLKMIDDAGGGFGTG